MDLRRAAVGLQKAAEQKLGIKPKITTGSRGGFTVLVDGKSIFDHKRDGALPSTEELLRRITAGDARGVAPASSV